MLRKIAFLISLNTIVHFCSAQVKLAGVVTDAGNEATLPYVNIGIRGKNIGTSSLLNGAFALSIPKENENDTLIFSATGYEEFMMPAGTITAKDLLHIRLKPQITELAGIAIVSQKQVEKKFGIKNNGLIHLGDGSTNQDDIFEIAQLIQPGSSQLKITSVNLYINESRKDSGTFRINFYACEANRPAKKIVGQSIIQTQQIQEGWLKFDLASYHISLKGNFIVAIEFLPSGKKTTPVFYGIKIGGTAKSYVRTSSQGTWSIPPHHYRLYITALTDNNKSQLKEDETEETETAPAATLFSRFVRDSFSVFIRLPEHYHSRKNRKFPVIYLLDANLFFDNLAVTMNEKKSNAILVGIGYKDFISMDSLRNRDYTYPKALEKYGFTVSGGADHFLSFMEQELSRFIDSAYRTDTANRTLMGHSLGAYFTLFALEQGLLDQQSVFAHYVAASPSLHYNEGYIIDQFRSLAPVGGMQKKTLAVSFGAKEDSEEGEQQEPAGVNNFNSFLKALSDKQFRNLQVDSHIYPSFGHMETAIPTFTKAVEELNQ